MHLESLEYLEYLYLRYVPDLLTYHPHVPKVGKEICMCLLTKARLQTSLAFLIRLHVHSHER